MKKRMVARPENSLEAEAVNQSSIIDVSPYFTACQTICLSIDSQPLSSPAHSSLIAGPEWFGEPARTFPATACRR